MKKTLAILMSVLLLLGLLPASLAEAQEPVTLTAMVRVVIQNFLKTIVVQFVFKVIG